MTVESWQLDVARLFSVLSVEGRCGPGTLCLAVGSSPLAMAVLGRGGTCLSLFADAAEARTAAKMGATDFTVDTLSEALRILKNELRQRRPIGVGLVGSLADNAIEALRRGVQPESISGPALESPWAAFLARGAVPLTPVPVRGEPWMSGWVLRRDDAASAAARREGDRSLLACLPAGEGESPALIARQWLLLAPRLFPRDRQRWYWARPTHEEGGRSV